MDIRQGNRTKRLIIRVMERSDIENARQLHNDESTLLMLTDVEHISQSQQDAWFETLSLSKKSKRYTVLEQKTGEFIGIFRADEIDLVNRSVCVGLDVIRNKRGNGFASEAYGYFLSYYFLQCGMNRVYLSVLSTNEIARSLYRSMGFTEEGIFREAIFRDGEYKDLISMSLLKREYDKFRQEN